jgi:hypothetical protein
LVAGHLSQITVFGGPLRCVYGLRVRVNIWPREETVERFVEHSGSVQHLDSGQVGVFVCSGVPEPLDREEQIRNQWTVRVGIPPLLDAVVSATELSVWRVAEMPSAVRKRSTVARNAVAARPGSAKSTRHARSTL